jgi:hypothetical protein
MRGAASILARVLEGISELWLTVSELWRPHASTRARAFNRKENPQRTQREAKNGPIPSLLAILVFFACFAAVLCNLCG